MERDIRRLKQSTRYIRKRSDQASTSATTKQADQSVLSYGSRSSMKASSASTRIDFFDKFRSISKKDYDKVQSASLAYLRTCNKEKLSPKPFSLLEKPADSELEIRNRISNRYTRPYAQALSHTTSLKRLSLKGSKLKSLSSSIILQNLNSKSLVDLNFSGNDLGVSAASQLSNFLLEDSCKLKTLELENCNIDDIIIAVLCKGIETNHTVKHLNLAKNSFKDGACIGKMLKSNYCLRTLDLHWNALKISIELFEGLEKNEGLLELDLSWNSLGADPDQTIYSLCDFIANNKDLRHLDLSFNSFDRESCEKIGKALENNHTIYGFHIVGNHACVDARGFLHALEVPSTNISHFKRILSEKREGENCWLCEKWVEFRIPIPNDEIRTVHLEIDGYKPCFVKDLQAPSLSRFLPPVPIQLYYSDSINEIVLHDAIPQVYHALFKRLNFLTPFGNQCSVNMSFATEPRAKHDPLPEESFVEILPWSIDRSVFKNCIFETAELANQCFEFDWANSRIPKLYSNDESLNKCKDILRKWYPYIKNTYRRLSVVSFVDVFGVSSNTLHEFLGSQKLFNSNFRISDLGVHWSATLKKSSKHKFKSKSALSRAEFLEILVRIAINKYSEPSAIHKLMDDIKDSLIENDPNAWRLDCYYCEEVDNIITTNEKLLKRVFKIFATRKIHPRKRRFITFEGFKEFTFLLGEKIQRHAGNVFISSMFTRVNELDFNDHMEMTVFEFYEALMRVINLKFNGGNLPEKFKEVLPILQGIVSSNRKNTISQKKIDRKGLITSRKILRRKTDKN